MGANELQQLASVIGGPAAVLIFMWLNRKREEPHENPVRDLVAKVDEMNARLIRVETILEERKG